MDNINFKKVLDDGELFDQQANYEENFEKINQEVVPKITDLETNKVDKETGKGLSTNDFDNTYKQKIDVDIPAQLNEKVQNFKLKNEVVNGDFDSGDASWIKTGVNLTIVSGIAEMLCQTPTGFIRQLFTTIVGNKYYFAGKIKSTSTLVKITFGNTDVFVKDLVNYNALSGIHTATSTGHGVSIYDTRSSGWDKVYINKIIIVNLTSIFGAGNEPTKLEMDELFKVVPNNWWNGEITLTQKQYMTWLLNLQRKNTNAIIALGGTIV